MQKLKKVTILGGGAAGLATGYYAAKRGYPFQIYESQNRLGGICATHCRQDGFCFDTGAHRFHNKILKVTKEIQGLLGDDLRKINIKSMIYLNNHFVDFPLSPLNLIKNLGIILVLKSGFDWIKSRVRFKKQMFHNFEEYAVYKYGRFIAKRLLLNYTEKLWGTSCDRLLTEITGERLKGLSLSSFIIEIFNSSEIKTTHLDGTFYYPRQGFGRIVEKMAEKICDHSCHTGKEITKVFHEYQRITAVELNHREVVDTDRVVSTLPLPRFIEMLTPACPPEILELSQYLTYRNIILIVFFLNRRSITSFGTVYFPDARFPFNRVSEPRNRSIEMSPPGKTSLLVEIPCDQSLRLTEASKQEYTSNVQKQLQEIGWVRDSDVLGTHVELVKYAYPLLLVEHQQRLEKIFKYLKQFDNLSLCGRNSLFKYTHFHDMMYQAEKAIASFSDSPAFHVS